MRLPDAEGDKPKRQTFKRYTIGFVHIDIAEVQLRRKLYLFVGIDRTDGLPGCSLDRAQRPAKRAAHAPAFRSGGRP